MAGAGGSGGGIVKIICKKLDVQSGGTISVAGGTGGNAPATKPDGYDNTGQAGSAGGGGGGGAIWILCQEITGAGTINAGGGGGGYGYKNGASGAGGHVRLDYIKSSFTGTIYSAANYGSSVSSDVKSNVGGGGLIFYT